MIIEQLQKAKFSDDEQELAEITSKIVNKIENQNNDTYFSESDYAKLLQYYLNKNDEASLKVMLSPSIIELLKTQPGKIKLGETERAAKLENVQLKILIECVKNGEAEKVEHLLKLSPHCILSLNKKLSVFEIGEMLPGSSLLHLALKYGQVAVAKLLVMYGSDPSAVDYYDNSVLHYGAMGGIDCYEYSKQLCSSKRVNIFGHTPENYLNDINQLPLVKQGALINKFSQYIKVNGYDESVIISDEKRLWMKGKDEPIKGSDVIAEMEEGICHGASFIKAINLVRGKDCHELHNKIIQAIIHWDGSIADLDKPLEDEDLKNEFTNPNSDKNSNTLRAVFEYMMNVILTSQEERSLSVVDIEHGNRVEMFELLKNRNDKLDQTKKLKFHGIDKHEFHGELRECQARCVNSHKSGIIIGT